MSMVSTEDDVALELDGDGLDEVLGAEHVLDDRDDLGTGLRLKSDRNQEQACEQDGLHV